MSEFTSKETLSLAREAVEAMRAGDAAKARELADVVRLAAPEVAAAHPTTGRHADRNADARMAARAADGLVYGAIAGSPAAMDRAFRRLWVALG